MAIKAHHVLRSLFFLSLTILQFGCVVQTAPPVDVSKEFNRLFAVADQVHARVGVYLNEDMRKYIYKPEKSPTPMQMEVGKNIVPVCMTMASAMFDSAVEVDSLPPYMSAYRPDVEAVIEPEILYVYGNTTGMLSGQIVAMVKLRIKAYDLSGTIIWQGEALGENQGGQVDVLSTLLGNVDNAGRAVGLAGLSAAIKIVKEFNVSKPPELYSLIEMKTLPQPKGQKQSEAAGQAERLFQRGMYQYDKKNFQQALYSFQQADRLNPEDLSTRFYLGVSQMYTGQKRKAIETLGSVLRGAKRGNNLSENSRQWMQRLNDPLKIGIVFTGAGEPMAPDVKRGLMQALADCGMYDIVTVQDTTEPLVGSTALQRSLAEASKKKARVVCVVQADRNVRDLTEANMPAGDIATEFALNTTLKAYSVQKKKPITDFILFDNAARMKSQANAETLQAELLHRSANRIVLSLLGYEIF